MYTCMRLTRPDGRFSMANFFLAFSIFCKHTSKFTCDPIFSVPDRKNCCRKLDICCRKLDSDTCEQRNIMRRFGKFTVANRAVGCLKSHTCVCTLTHNRSLQKTPMWLKLGRIIFCCKHSFIYSSLKQLHNYYSTYYYVITSDTWSSPPPASLQVGLVVR